VVEKPFGSKNCIACRHTAGSDIKCYPAADDDDDTSLINIEAFFELGRTDGRRTSLLRHCWLRASCVFIVILAAAAVCDAARDLLYT